MSTLDAFEAFARANKGVQLEAGEIPELKFKDFRHFEFFEQKSASDFKVTPGGKWEPVTSSPTGSPTKRLTQVPTKGPTNGPTKGPTKAPTKAPTNGPTKAPVPGSTVEPTNGPTKGPTNGPTKVPTEPTNLPTVSPSTLPTIVTQEPTKAPTQAPKMSSTESPTKSPVPSESSSEQPSIKTKDCVLDKNGNFNSSFAGAKQHFVDYRYTITTDPSTKADIEGEVLNEVEMSILNFILPDILPDGSCSNRRNLSDRNRRRLAVMGASASPPDKIATDATCSAGNTGNECNVVDGLMTVYSDSDSLETYSELQKSVCGSMDEINFSLVHPSIVGVSCVVNTSTFPGGGDNSDGSTGQAPRNDPVSQSLSPAPMIYSAIAAAAVVFGVYFYRRRQKKGGEPLSQMHLDDSDVNNPNSFSYDEACLPNNWGSTAGPALDFSTIVPQRGHSPETIEESHEEHLSEEELNDLDEISLNGLDSTNGTSFS